MTAIIALILLLTPLLYLPVAKEAFSAPKNLFLFILCCVLGIMLFWKAMKEKVRVSLPAAVLFFSFSFLAVVSCFYSGNPLVSMKYAGDILLYSVLAIAAAHCAVSDKRSLPVFADAICWASIGASILGLFQVAHIDFFQLTSDIMFREMSNNLLGFKERISSTMGNANFFGGYLAMSIPVAFAMFIGSNGVKRGIFYGTAVIAGLVCLIKTETANAWVAFAIGMALYLVLAFINLGEKRRKLQIALAVLLVGAVCSVAILHPEEAISKLKKAGTFSTLAERGRIVMWNAGIEMIKERPFFGFGAAQYKVNVSKYETKVLARPGYEDYPYQMTKDAHNDYIQIWAELGIVGVGIFVLIIAGSLIFGLAGALHQETKERSLYIGMLAAMAGYAVHAIFNFPMKISPIFSVFCVFGGVLMSAVYFEVSFKRIITGRLCFTAAILFFTGIAAVCVLFFAANFEAGYGVMLYDRARYNEALVHFNRSLVISEKLDYTRDLRTRFYTGNIYYNRQDYLAAKGEFDEEILKNPCFADSRYNMGLILDNLGRKDEAVATYLKALEFDKSFSQAADKLAEHGIRAPQNHD